MNNLIRVAVLALVLALAAPASAQDRPLPEPVPMGVPYIYQPGNPYWYLPVAPLYNPYPFGAAVPVYGRYSWDYGVYYARGYAAYPGYVVYYTPFYPTTVAVRGWVTY